MTDAAQTNHLRLVALRFLGFLFALTGFGLVLAKWAVAFVLTVLFWKLTLGVYPSEWLAEVNFMMKALFFTASLVVVVISNILVSVIWSLVVIAIVSIAATALSLFSKCQGRSKRDDR